MTAVPTAVTDGGPLDATPGLSLSRTLLPLLAIALSLAIGFTMMGSFSTVQEGAKAEMRLTDNAMGLIQGLSAAIPLLLLSIPIGILVDRTNRVRLLVGLSIAGTAGTLLTAVAPSAPILFVARMLVGIGTTGALTAALSLAADLCIPSQRGRAILIVALGQRLGIAAAFALAGWLFGYFANESARAIFGGALPWRSVHYALAIFGALLILPLLLLREPPRHEVEAGPSAPLKVIAGELWSRRAFLAPLFIGQISVVMADAAAGIWAVPILSRVHGLQPQQFAGWMGMLIFGTGIGGAVLGGLFADWGQKSPRRGGLLVGAVSAAAVGVPAALFALSSNIWLFGFALGVLVLCGTITGLIVSVALTVLLPNELRGLSIGAFIAIAGLIGYGVAPSLVTIVSSALGGEQHLAMALSIVGVTVSIVSVVAFWIAMRRAPVAPAATEA